MDGLFVFPLKSEFDMSQIRNRLHFSADSLAVWTAVALAVAVRLGWIKHVPW